MRVQINGQWVNMPSSLSEITLRQRIDYHYQHEVIIAEMFKSLSEIEDPDEIELEKLQIQFEQAFRGFSFFSGIPVEVLKESDCLDSVVSIYFSCLSELLAQESELELQKEFMWNNEKWVLAAPELKHGDAMTFGEFIDSKQMIQNLNKLGKSKWECLIPLCAIFLRKENEPYSESFLFEGSDRLMLMESLPLDIALGVGFFLTVSMTLLVQTSLSSTHQEQNQPENTQPSTLKTSVG